MNDYRYWLLEKAGHSVNCACLAWSLSVCVCAFLFGFEGGMWDLSVLFLIIDFPFD